MKPFSFFVKFSSCPPLFSSGRAALATSSPLETWRRRRRSRSKLGNLEKEEINIANKVENISSRPSVLSLYALLLLVAFQYSLNKSSLWTLTTFKKVEKLSGIQIAMCPFPSLPHLWCLQICNPNKIIQRITCHYLIVTISAYLSAAFTNFKHMTHTATSGIWQIIWNLDLQRSTGHASCRWMLCSLGNRLCSRCPRYCRLFRLAAEARESSGFGLSPKDDLQCQCQAVPR